LNRSLREPQAKAPPPGDWPPFVKQDFDRARVCDPADDHKALDHKVSERAFGNNVTKHLSDQDSQTKDAQTYSEGCAAIREQFAHVAFHPVGAIGEVIPEGRLQVGDIGAFRRIEWKVNAYA
jgi:hypothetical protein